MFANDSPSATLTDICFLSDFKYITYIIKLFKFFVYETLFTIYDFPHTRNGMESGGYAQETPEVTLDFTSNTEWNLPTAKTTKGETYSNGTYSVSFGSLSSNGYYYYNGQKAVLMGKKGANIILPKFDFDVEKIVVIKHAAGSAASSNVTQNIFVDNVAVSTETKGANADNTYIIKDSYTAAGNIYILKVTNAYNTQFSKIEIYKKTSTKAPTTLSFNTDFDATKTYTFKNGIAPSDYTKPTVTVNPSEATGHVVYKSSDEDVVSVGTDGALDFTGKTKYNTEATITAQFIGTGNYTNSEEISYKVKNVAAKASLAFSESSVTVMQGKESEFVAPTLTLLDADGNPVTLGDNDIYYESSAKNVADVAVASGKVTFAAPGTTTVTASYLGNNADYENLTASYTLVYKEKEKIATTVEFTSTDNSVNINDNIFVKAIVKANGAEVEGATVTYSASNENVIVDEHTGEVVGNTEGTSTITATFAGNADYAASSSEPFEVTVTDPNKKTVTFDFTNPVDCGYDISATTNLSDGEQITKNDVVLTNVKNPTTATRFAFKTEKWTFRFYKDVELNLKAPEGYALYKVEFVDDGSNTTNAASNMSIKPEAYNSTSATWSGLSEALTITVPKTQVFLNSMTVYCIKKNEITLTEGNNDNVLNSVLDITDNFTDVTLNRTMKADGGWYTFSVPFDVADVSTTPLKDAEIRQYKSMTGSTMNFEKTTSLKAVHAYLVKPTKDIENPVFKNVTISLGDNVIDGADGYEFVGIYSDRRLETDGTNLFLGAGNKFYVPTSDDCTLKALRGYFVAPSAETGTKMSISIDGNATSISALNSGKAILNGKVYNLNGQYVGNDVKALQKGIYMVNGKKYIVK